MTKKLSRIVALMLAVIMSFSMLLVPVEAASFKDVSNKAWYKAAVDYVAERGWMAGVSSTTFAPNMKVTRGMAVTVLAKVAEADLSAYEPAFADTEAGKWYTKAAAWAADKGIVAGVGDGMFAPNRVITRQDLAAILNKFINKQDYQITLGEPVSFNDMDSVAGYATEAVSFCAAAGLVSGFEDSTFRPQQTATRAQLAVMMMKLDQLIQGYAQPMPAQSFNGEAGEDMTVSVNAPEGALPENTNMTVSRVIDVDDLASIQANFEGNVMAAADISFSKNGAEIEPEKKVEVLISLEGLENIHNPAVYHIGNDGSIELVYDVELVSVNRGGTKALRFFAKDFSIYVVIDKPIDELSRMRINFYNEWVTEESKLIAYMYVKNSDKPVIENGEVVTDYITDIIYDPGIGNYTPGTDELFVGWSLSLKDKEGNPISIEGITDDYEFDGLEYDEESKDYTVKNIRDLVTAMATANKIEDGYVLDCYAMIMKMYTVTYLGEQQDVALGAVSQKITKQRANAGEHVFIEIDQPYVPGTAQQNFEGWNVYSQGENIKGAVYKGQSAQTPYPNKTVLELAGSVKLAVFAPSGFWLTFKENGKGGTFNAPVFLKNGDTIQEKTANLLPMVRKGYTFSHWCTNKDCTHAGTEADPCPDLFVLEGTLEADTVIYAHWIANTTARVTVIFWIQTPDGNSEQYDTDHSEIIENGRVGQKVTVAQSTSGTTQTITVTVPVVNSNGSNGNRQIQYTGINPNHFAYDSADNNVQITPEGNTIVNVHLTRKKYKLTFTDPYNNQIVYGYTQNQYTGAITWQTANISGTASNVNPTNTKEISGYTLGYITSGSWWSSTTTYYIKIGNSWYEITNGSSVYNSNSLYHVGKRPGNNSTVYEIEAFYGQDVSSYFPIKLSNGIHYDIGERWNPQGDSIWTEVMVYVNEMPDRNVAFECNLSTNGKKTMGYYVQALPNAPAQTNDITYQSQPYNLRHLETPNYYGATIEDYIELYGFTKQAVTNQNGNALTLATVSGANGTFYTYNGAIAENVRFIYTRNKYPLTFMDGTCYDSDNNVIAEDSDGQYKDPEQFYFEADITEALEYKPTKEGYVFDGWYIDPGCHNAFDKTSMDVGGYTLYAKWHQIEYRVFLHPNAKIEDENGVPYNDSTLGWGADGQQEATLSFKLGYGKPVSQLTGIRREYEMVGWFLDEDCTIPYNQGSFEANETTVTTPYDQTDSTELDKWGDPKTNTNSDAENNRYWITKRLDLYCLWRAKLTGADGIGVIYDATDEGTNAPTDSLLYKDKAYASAQGASTPKDEQLTFMYWIVQKWDKDAQNYDNEGNPTTKGAFVDTDEIVYPGGQFQIRKSYAHEVELPGSTEANPAFSYTMQLRAVYAIAEDQLPTHITWVGNGGVTGDDKTQKASAEVKINEAVDVESGTVFTRAGCTFLGWARLEETESLKKKDDQGNIVKDENGNDVFLSYAEATGRELTAADLWLVYNPADGRDPDSTPYYTVIEDGEIMVDDEGNAVHAEQVAADEKDPYNVLYAVWSRDLFYVFHSSTGIMQAFEVPVTQVVSNTVTKFEALPFDITALVPTGYIYGGYYMTYGGVTQSLVDAAVNAYTVNAAEAGWNTSTNTYSFQAGENFEAYTGNSAKSTVTGSNFWTRSMAYKVEDNMSDTQKAAVNGETMLPQNGTVYYLKEVPKDYLANKFFYVYDNLNNEVDESGNVVTGEDGNPVKVQTLEDLYFISVIDDAYYKTIGYKIADGVNENNKDMMAEVLNANITKRTTLARSVKFLQQNAGPVDPETGKPTNKTTIIKPKKASGDGEDVIEFGVNGYLEVVQVKKDYFNQHKKFTVRPTWETLDGVAVSGTTALGVTIGENGKVTDTDFGSTVYDYHRIYIDLNERHYSFKDNDGNISVSDWNAEPSRSMTVIHFLGHKTQDPQWAKLNIDSNNIAYVDVPDGYSSMIIVLCNKGEVLGDWIWGQKWAQTVTIPIHTNKNYISSFYGYNDIYGVPATDNNTVWDLYEAN